jgi:hypothetical protein
MDFLNLINEVGFPIAGSLAAGYFVFLTLRFILAGVTGGVTTLKNIIAQLYNRLQTMNNVLVNIDALLSYALVIKPKIVSSWERLSGHLILHSVDHFYLLDKQN